MEKKLTMQYPITLIGTGAVGTSLALGLHSRGVRIGNVVSRTVSSARRFAKKVHASDYSDTVSRPIAKKSAIIITVPDDAVSLVVKRLVRSRNDFSGSIVFHTSGTLSSKELAPLRAKGASVASFHPLQSFPQRNSTGKEWNGIAVALEGDRKAVRIAKAVARILKSHPFSISQDDKTLYHIAAVFASNYLVTVLSVTEELLQQCRLPKKSLQTMFGPLIDQTLRNIFRLTPAKALTGPITRNDLRTIRHHISTLSTPRNSHLVPLYASLGIATARLAQSKRKHAR